MLNLVQQVQLSIIKTSDIAHLIQNALKHIIQKPQLLFVLFIYVKPQRGPWIKMF